MTALSYGTRARSLFALGLVAAVTGTACHGRSAMNGSVSRDAGARSRKDAGGVSARTTDSDASAGDGGASTAGNALAMNPGVPPEVAQAFDEWPLPGRDYNNSRYTQDSSITSANVSRLQEGWRV